VERNLHLFLRQHDVSLKQKETFNKFITVFALRCEFTT